MNERFWSKVDRGAPEQCWPWTASRQKKASGQLMYGKFGRGGKRGGWEQAHRVAYELSVGPIPPGMHVLHSCDNTACCNPAHLFLGTMLDNVADKVKKGRHRWRTHYGEEAGNSKLTWVAVTDIRSRFAAGESRASIARSYDVAWPTINRVVTNNGWVDIERAVLEQG